MKKLSFTLMAAAAAFLFVAHPASAGILTLADGSPTYTPPENFTDNTIVADTIVVGGLIHLEGTTTVAPNNGKTATIMVSGTYSAMAGEMFSVAYKFAGDLNTTGPVDYTLSGSLSGVPIPPIDGTITPGLHVYQGTLAAPPFLADIAGNFEGTLTLTFTDASPGKGPSSAAPGTLDLTVQQIDFKLDTQPAGLSDPSQQQNISTRLNVGTGDNVLIGGFIINGNDPKLVVLRGLGPTLSGQIGGASFLADPMIELHDSSGAVIATNDNWMDLSADDQTVLTDNDLAPGDPAEAALVKTLDPGAYTVVMSGVDNTTGVGLVEAYDLDMGTTDSKLANISTRGSVDSGDNVMIGGFILGAGGGGFTQIVVRGLGPSLADEGVDGALADPMIELHNGDGDLIDSNDNWMDDPDSNTVALFGLAPTDDKEAALYEVLEPGNYTVILSGVGDTSGIGLVESYNVDDSVGL